MLIGSLLFSGLIPVPTLTPANRYESGAKEDSCNHLR